MTFDVFLTDSLGTKVKIPVEARDEASAEAKGLKRATYMLPLSKGLTVKSVKPAGAKDAA